MLLLVFHSFIFTRNLNYDHDFCRHVCASWRCSYSRAILTSCCLSLWQLLSSCSYRLSTLPTISNVQPWSQFLLYHFYILLLRSPPLSQDMRCRGKTPHSGPDFVWLSNENQHLNSGAILFLSDWIISGFCVQKKGSFTFEY